MESSKVFVVFENTTVTMWVEDYEQLSEALIKSTNPSEDELKITYEDEDKDMITVSSEDDFKEAVVYFESINQEIKIVVNKRYENPKKLPPPSIAISKIEPLKESKNLLTESLFDESLKITNELEGKKEDSIQKGNDIIKKLVDNEFRNSEVINPKVPKEKEIKKVPVKEEEKVSEENMSENHKEPYGGY